MRAVLIHNSSIGGLNARGAKLTPRPQKTEQRECEQSGRPLAMSPSLCSIRTCELHQNSRAFSIRTSPNPEPVPNRWSRCAAPSAQGGRRPPEDTGRPADEVGCWGRAACEDVRTCEAPHMRCPMFGSFSERHILLILTYTAFRAAFTLFKYPTRDRAG